MELIFTWKELKAAQDRINEIDAATDAICANREMSTRREEYNKLWDERYSLESKVEKMRPRVIPEVGMPCTVRYYSDSSGAHVEKVVSPKHIIVKQDGLYSGTKEYTYRKNGLWVQKGTTTKDWGTLCYLGYRHDYYDMSY